MTQFRRKVLELLATKGCLYADEIGSLLWPNSKAKGSSNGGPSGYQCAVNWQLGKIAAATQPEPWVTQTHNGRALNTMPQWTITYAGRKAMTMARSAELGALKRGKGKGKG